MTFEAAHKLPHVPAGHKCGRLHGHSFKVTVIVRGPLSQKLGWVADYADIKKAAEPVINELDHHYLNEIQGLENPTSEILAKWIYERLKPSLHSLSQIIVAETCTTECRFPVA